MGAARSRVSVLLVGLDGAGKTTMFFNLRLGTEGGPEEVPTKGFNYSVIERAYSKTRFQFHVFDLAGQPHLRPLWRHFYRSARPHAVLFVVDANDRARLPEAKKEFHRLLHQSELLNSLILVVGNVKNTKGQLKDSELRDRLEIPLQHEIRMVNAREPQELKSAMHFVCQELLSKPP